MESTVKASPTLSQEEWELVIELLEREKAELPVEIHHTRTVSYRDDLRRKVEMVERLLQRLHEYAA